MGRSHSLLFVFWTSVALAQGAQPATEKGPLRPPRPLHAEVVLAADGSKGLASAADLGSGGVSGGVPSELSWSEDGCVTPGGVRVQVRSVGVKLGFPSGKELLVAADGHLHLRSGEVGGPFPGGMELRLGDGALVRISLAQSNNQRVRDVVVIAEGRALQPWRRGEEATEIPRVGGFAGVHLAVCGEGEDVYRAIALGPLVVLDRLLVAEARAATTPEQRLVVLVSPLLGSLAVMQRQHREPDAAVRRALTSVAAVADRGDQIFPSGASLPRAEQDKLRWLLRGGFELQLDLDGAMAPRLQLFAGETIAPMIEWTLRSDAAAFLANPRDDRPEQRWHGNGTRLQRVVTDLQAREELFERAHALRVIERLQRGRKR